MDTLIDWSTFDFNGIRLGRYSDQYFENSRYILQKLAAQKYIFDGTSPRSKNTANVQKVEVGNMEVDMQIFTRRKPFSILSGIPIVKKIFEECVGYFENNIFHKTFHNDSFLSREDGDELKPWDTALRFRGKYSDFSVLETVYLGILTRATRIATNTYHAYEAMEGNPLLFFPARFDSYENQQLDGYAYAVGTAAYNRKYAVSIPLFVSTPAQGEWIQKQAVGTIPHAYVICFLRDTASAMLHFARIMPPEVKRVALVDTNNDCVADSLTTAKTLFLTYKKYMEKKDENEAKKYILFGVRPDTSDGMIDKSIKKTGNIKKDGGVNPQLVRNIRKALDMGYDNLDISPQWKEKAKEYFQNIKIIVSGGFHPEKMKAFTKAKVPVDMYGVGSYFFSGENNDFTADVVRIKINNTWIDMAKEGRKARDVR